MSTCLYARPSATDVPEVCWGSVCEIDGRPESRPWRAPVSFGREEIAHGPGLSEREGRRGGQGFWASQRRRSCGGALSVTALEKRRATSPGGGGGESLDQAALPAFLAASLSWWACMPLAIISAASPASPQPLTVTDLPFSRSL